jgi:pectate lyase
MRSSSHTVCTLTLALQLAAAAPVGAGTAVEAGRPAETRASVVAGASTQARSAPLAETSPTGFAADTALGRNGTTGGADGATVTVDSGGLEFYRSSNVIVRNVRTGKSLLLGHSASGYDASGPGRPVQRNNVFTGSGTCEANGTVVEPRTYHAYTLDPTADVPALVRAGAGTGRIGA